MRADPDGRFRTFYFQDDVRQASRNQSPWGDLVFDIKAGELTVAKTSGDPSTIVDLGEKSWDQIDSLPGQLPPTDGSSINALAGHAYLVHENDQRDDFWAVVRVVQVVEHRECRVEWARLGIAGPLPAPAISPAAQNRLASLLKSQDSNVDAAFLKAQQPRAVLQVRNGADGGNPNRIDLLGKTSIYIKHVSSAPLSFTAGPMMNEDGTAYCKGCWIPPGKVLVIKSIRYAGAAAGDSNGHGELTVHAGDQVIIDVRNQPNVPQNKWEGRIEIRHGQEDSVYLEVANSSMGDVEFEGEFIDDANHAQAVVPSS